MTKKKSIFGRAVSIIMLCLFIFSLLVSSAYIFQNEIYNLSITEQNNKITKWKFTSGQSLEAIKKEDTAWKYSNEIFGIRKPIEDKYIRLQTTVTRKVQDAVLFIMTQSDSVKVYLDDKELQGKVRGNRLTKLSFIEIPLPDYYVDKKLEIFAKSSLVFDIKVSITQQNLIDQINSQARQVKVSLGLVISIIGILIFLISLIISIKLRGVGRIILSGILVSGTGITYILVETLPILSKFTNLFNSKSQFIMLMLLLPLIFGISLYTSRKKGLFSKIILTLFTFTAIPLYFLQNEVYINYYLTGYIILSLLMTFLFLRFTKGLLTENLFKNKFLYFAMMLSGLSVSFDFANSVFGISPILAEMFFVSFVLYFIALANITIAKAIYINVRIDERNDQVRRNRNWIERIVYASARIFAKQQIEEYCIETAVSVKELILNDMKETAEQNETSLDNEISGVSVSVAIKKDGIFEEIYNEGLIINCKYELIEQRYSANKGEGVFFGGSYLVILLFLSEELKGIVYFEGIQHGVSENLKNIIRIAYGNISVAFDNLKLKSDIVQTQQSVFIYLAEMSEAKSAETGFHIKRVSEYVRTICNSLGMSPHEADVVTKASMMHDIGKLAIPEELIKKTGDLSASEYETIKQHVIYGHAMLSKSSGEFMEAAAIIAQQHHEKWNGEGYLGLSGENIHLYARITSVADVFDALMRKRSYKEAWTPQEAIGFILEKSGTHFDPMVTDAFIRAIDRIIEIKNEIID